MNQFFKSRSGYLGIGLVIGLIIGLNIEGLWPSVPLHASSTHGIEKFAIATGLVDNNVEALYFLDFLTGDMRAAARLIHAASRPHPTTSSGASAIASTARAENGRAASPVSRPK